MEKFKNALWGLSLGFRDTSILIQVGLAIVTVGVFIFIGIGPIEWIIIIALIILVIVVEWINTAIEEVVNYISEDYNEKARDIKDLSAGAVLLSCVFAFIIGMIILIQNI